MPNQIAKIKEQKQDQKPKLELRYRAFYLAIRIIRFLENIEYKQSVKIISDQLIRSSTSIGANIIEARGSSSRREFLKYFEIALKSAQESKYWLALLRELISPNEKNTINEFINEAEEITKVLSASILTMKGKREL